MARQARAEATRGKIMDAAVDLFAGAGYGVTDLAAIIKRAGVTKGAFYYHFESKEDIAAAIIAEAGSRIEQAFSDARDSSPSALRNLILGTFEVAHLKRADKLVRIGNLLAQSLSQVGNAGRRVFPEWVPAFVASVKEVAAQGDLRPDVTPEDAGETIYVTVLGGQLLTDALGDDPLARLTRGWTVLIDAIVPEKLAPHFHDCLDQIGAQFAPS